MEKKVYRLNMRQNRKLMSKNNNNETLIDKEIKNILLKNSENYKNFL